MRVALIVLLCIPGLTASAQADPAEAFIAFFEARCLPLLDGRPADETGLMSLLQSPSDNRKIDPLSGFVLNASDVQCNVDEIAGKFSPREVTRLTALVAPLAAKAETRGWKVELRHWPDAAETSLALHRP